MVSFKKHFFSPKHPIWTPFLKNLRDYPLRCVNVISTRVVGPCAVGTNIFNLLQGHPSQYYCN